MSRIYTDYAILAAGITSVLTGGIVLVAPTVTTNIMTMSLSAYPDTAPSIQANAVASIATGAYHILAFHQANHDFYRASIFMRLLFTLVFWIEQRGGLWWSVSMYNLFGAAITSVLLAVEEEGSYYPSEYDSDDDSTEFFDAD